MAAAVYIEMPENICRASAEIEVCGTTHDDDDDEQRRGHKQETEPRPRSVVGLI